MKILLHDDCGNEKELTVDPVIPLIPSEHAISCACCRSWVFDECAIPDDCGTPKWCSLACQAEERMHRKMIYGG